MAQAGTKMTPQQQKAYEEAIASSQGMLDNAPTVGKRGTYIKLPEGIKFFNPTAGKVYRLVFMRWKAGKGNRSYAEGSLAVNRYLYVHRGIGPSNETYVCTEQTNGQPCAICKEMGVMRAGKASWDTIKELKAKVREMFLVFDLDDPREGLQVWEESVHLFGDKLREKVSAKDKFKVFAHEQFKQVVEVKGTKKQIEQNSCTEFTVVDMDTLTDKLPSGLIEKGFKTCLDSFVIIPPAGKISKLFEQTGGSKADVNGEHATTPADEEEPAPVDEEVEGVTPADEEPAPMDEDIEPAAEPEPEAESAGDDDVVQVDDVDVEEVPLNVGDKVEFEYKKKVLKGVVTEVSDDSCKVKSGGKIYGLPAKKVTIV